MILDRGKQVILSDEPFIQVLYFARTNDCNVLFKPSKHMQIIGKKVDLLPII